MKNLKTFESFCQSLNETTDYLELQPIEGEDDSLKFNMSFFNAYPFVIKRGKVYISEVGNLDHYSFCETIKNELGVTHKQIDREPMGTYIDYKGRLYQFDDFAVLCDEDDTNLGEAEYAYINMAAEEIKRRTPHKKVYLGVLDIKLGTRLIPLLGSQPFNHTDWLSAKRTERENEKISKVSEDPNDIRATFRHFY